MSGRPGPAGRRAPRISPGEVGPALADAARRLTDRDRWLLRMLHEHTVLTTPQLTALHYAGTGRSVQVRLRELARWQVTARFQPMTDRGSAPGHHVLGPLGAQILAAEIGAEVAALGWRRERALAVAHRLSLAHDTAMTDLVCELVAAPDLRVTSWWSPGRCRRHLGHHVRPDALITAATGLPARPAGPGGRPVAPWRIELACEYDTGTTTLGALAGKLRGYHDLGAATGVPVTVAVWVARPGREPGARRALAAAHRALPDPRRVRVITATPAPGHPATPGAAAAGAGAPGAVQRGTGAAGAVWLPLYPAPAMTRVGLAELTGPARPGIAEILRGPADLDDPPSDPRTGPDRHGGRARIELPAPSPYPPPIVLPPPAHAPRAGRPGTPHDRRGPS